MLGHLDRLRQRIPIQPKILIGFGILTGLMLIFIELAEDVLENERDSFDTAILTALRSPDDRSNPVGPFWLEVAFRDITALGGATVLTLLTVIAVLYLLIAGHRMLAVLTAISISLGSIVESLLKLGFARTRPDVVPHLVEVSSMSFPSGHAMISAMTYLTVGALLAEAQSRWRLRIYVFGTSVLLAFLIGISRVYLGVHWPSDVLAGWTVGAAWALIFWFVAEWIRKPR